MRCSREEAMSLLKKWKEDGVWIYVVVFLGEDEEHRFWAKVDRFLDAEVFLAGVSASISLLLEEAEFEYLEPSESPPDLRARFERFAFCFSIRSNKVSAFLCGQEPKGK